MISTQLVQYAEYVRWVLAAMLVAMLLLGWVLARRDARRVCTALTAFGALAALALTSWPEPRAAIDEVHCAVDVSVPFQGLDTLANLALLVPVAYFATLASRRPVAVALVASVASALVETVQALVPAIGRVCDTNDWWMNTVGVVLGVLLAAVTLALAGRRRTPGRGADDDTPLVEV